jgi:hypothetical protein
MCKINDFLPNLVKNFITPMDHINRIQEIVDTVSRMQCYLDAFRTTMGDSFKYVDVKAYLRIQLSALTELDAHIYSIRANIAFVVPELDKAPTDPRIYGDIPSSCDNCD